MAASTCAKCGGRMDVGFLLDLAHGNAKKTTEWVEGAPEKAWYGLKLRGKRKLAVETSRCARCGYLESYAPG